VGKAVFKRQFGQGRVPPLPARRAQNGRGIDERFPPFPGKKVCQILQYVREFLVGVYVTHLARSFVNVDPISGRLTIDRRTLCVSTPRGKNLIQFLSSGHGLNWTALGIAPSGRRP
jgi:hypothetical protein